MSVSSERSLRPAVPSEKVSPKMARLVTLRSSSRSVLSGSCTNSQDSPRSASGRSWGGPRSSTNRDVAFSLYPGACLYTPSILSSNKPAQVTLGS